MKQGLKPSNILSLILSFIMAMKNFFMAMSSIFMTTNSDFSISIVSDFCNLGFLLPW